MSRSDGEPILKFVSFTMSPEDTCPEDTRTRDAVEKLEPDLQLKAMFARYEKARYFARYEKAR